MSQYEIQTRLNCLIVKARHGVSTSEFNQIIKQAPDGSVVDSALSARMRVFTVIGLPADLTSLSDELTRTGELVAQYSEDPVFKNLKKHQINWLANGARTIFSDALFAVTTGVNIFDSKNIPLPKKPDELESCVRLLKDCPELQDCLWKMKPACEKWRDLVYKMEDHIDDLIDSLDTSLWASTAKNILTPLKARS